MENAVVISGRMTGPTSVELDEPVPSVTGAVEIILRVKPTLPATVALPEDTVFEFLRKLPAGTRTREDIDRQIREERDSWGDR